MANASSQTCKFAMCGDDYQIIPNFELDLTLSNTGTGVWIMPHYLAIKAMALSAHKRAVYWTKILLLNVPSSVLSLLSNRWPCMICKYFFVCLWDPAATLPAPSFPTHYVQNGSENSLALVFTALYTTWDYWFWTCRSLVHADIHGKRARLSENSTSMLLVDRRWSCLIPERLTPSNNESFCVLIFKES